MGSKAAAGIEDVAVKVSGNAEAFQRMEIFPCGAAGTICKQLTAFADEGVPLVSIGMGGVPLTAAHQDNGDAKAF